MDDACLACHTVRNAPIYKIVFNAYKTDISMVFFVKFEVLNVLNVAKIVEAAVKRVGNA